ncbi:MAG TPA: HEAT repeat domain-containing protein [Nitrospiraceae bacterium]|nr:HEAT repeat domain-containing protein [Nitrospiraceae bacterium]
MHLRMLAHDTEREQGQVNLTAALLLVATIVAGVWIWKRLPLETQDYLIDQAVPLAMGLAVLGVVAWVIVRAVRLRRWRQRERERLIRAFTRANTQEKRLDIAFALIEVNQYRPQGLEEIRSELQTLLATVLTRALDDKQHPIRGMAASHLGVIGDSSAVRLLMNALEDDHAYVRACAALGLGRLRATEAKEKLKKVSVEDWDQTVRSRAREAVERIP